MLLRKIALSAFITSLGLSLTTKAVLVGAQAYKKEFSDGTHYVMCLEDWHDATPVKHGSCVIYSALR